MKTAVVYYSDTGTNAGVARTIADALKAEVREIKGVGTSSFMVKCIGAMCGMRFRIMPMDTDLSAFDSLILCGPIWATSPACQLMTFISKASLAGKKVAVVFACGNYKVENAEKRIRSALAKKGASVATVEILDVGTLKEGALTRAAFELAQPLARKLAGVARDDARVI